MPALLLHNSSKLQYAKPQKTNCSTAAQLTRRKKIMPARGPRRLLWVVVVTTSAYWKGCRNSHEANGMEGVRRVVTVSM